MVRSMVVVPSVMPRTYGDRREGADRLRAGHPGLQRPGSVRRAGHRARGAPVRLAVALRAGHRRLPGPDRRARRGRRAHHQDQVRVLGARGARPQPDAAGQGAGDARPPEPRPAPPRLRPRRAGPGRAPGLRRGARRSGRSSSTRCCRSSAASGPARRWTTRARASTTRARSCGPCPLQQPLDIWLGRHRALGAAALRPPRRRLAALVLHARGRAGRHRRHPGPRRRGRPRDRGGALRRAHPLLATVRSPRWSPPRWPTGARASSPSG